jgi:hypothetical protein
MGIAYINYLAEATTMELLVPPAGSGLAGAGLFLRMPGRRKSKGETDWEALMPPHPLVARAIATNIAIGVKFQFNLTHPL